MQLFSNNIKKKFDDMGISFLLIEKWSKINFGEMQFLQIDLF